MNPKTLDFDSDIAAQTEAVRIDYRRRLSIATGVAIVVEQVWLRVASLSEQMRSRQASKWRKLEFALIMAGAILSWLIEGESKWAWNVGTAIMALATVTYVSYCIASIFDQIEHVRASALSEEYRYRWLSSGASDDHYRTLRRLAVEENKIRDIGISRDDTRLQELERDKTECWIEIRSDLLDAAAGAHISFNHFLKSL